MRENRPYGSEGGEGQALPDPIVCRLFDALLARLPHGGDPESLVDGGGAGEHLSLGLLEGAEYDVRFFARQRNPPRQVCCLGQNLQNCAPVRVEFHLDQFKSLELSIEADGQSDNFQLSSVLCGLYERGHDRHLLFLSVLRCKPAIAALVPELCECLVRLPCRKL